MHLWWTGWQRGSGSAMLIAAEHTRQTQKLQWQAERPYTSGGTARPCDVGSKLVRCHSFIYYMSTVRTENHFPHWLRSQPKLSSCFLHGVCCKKRVLPQVEHDVGF